MPGVRAYWLRSEPSGALDTLSVFAIGNYAAVCWKTDLKRPFRMRSPARRLNNSGRWLWAALLALVALAAVPIPGNPYDYVIAEIAGRHGWDSNEIRMLEGENTELYFLRWTRVDLVIRPPSSQAPVFVTARTRPFTQSYISCYSAKGREHCDS